MRELDTCVILAAGLGTRLRPHTLTTPKPMLPVAGRPILEWKMLALPPGIREVILVVGYRKEQIMRHFRDFYLARRIRYVTQETMDGTGGALHLCRDLVKGRFMVLNGDDLYGKDDLTRCMAYDLAILAKPTGTPGRYGSFRTDADGNLIDIVEGAEVQAGALVNTGCYVLDTRFFDYPLVPIRDGKEFGLPQTLVTMAKDHPIAIPKARFWLPIGHPDDLAAATAALEAREHEPTV